MSIIPQDPILFRGTIRTNLDPFNEFSDDVLWSALRRVAMNEKIAATKGKLDAEVVESGNNFSVGVRASL